jgi:hypothetical protein
VDAVVVTSWGPTHAEYVLASIAAGKNVFCEKPLAESSEACLQILDAETGAGRRLVQVGYMRRYDAAYRALKQVVDSGSIGAPLLMHCAHRNPSQPGHFTPSMSITDSGVHDIDTARWMFGEEIVATWTHCTPATAPLSRSPTGRSSTHDRHPDRGPHRRGPVPGAERSLAGRGSLRSRRAWVASSLLPTALRPFPITVADTLSTVSLGYDYAVFSSRTVLGAQP